jgi:hypothetical protein
MDEIRTVLLAKGVDFADLPYQGSTMAPWHDIGYWTIGIAAALGWLGVLAIVIGVCRSAARGDRALLEATAPGPPAQPDPVRLRLVA